MNNWNQSVDSLLDKIRLNSIMLASKHIKNHLYYLNCSKYFEIPVIILSVVSSSFSVGSEKLHPTQKPLELCEWLIKTYSNEGDLLMDFCMGSGTTIQAAINTNRKYIGIEKDKDIYETAKTRLNLLL